MDDESQRLGLLTPPIRKTQLTYDQIPPFGRIGDFQSLCIVMGGLEQGHGYGYPVLRPSRVSWMPCARVCTCACVRGGAMKIAHNQETKVVSKVEMRAGSQYG